MSFLGGLLLLSSCAHPQEDFESSVAELGEEWSTNLQAPMGTAFRPDWDAAVRHLLEHNPSIRQSEEAVRRAERGISEVYRDLIPAPDLNLRVTDALDDLDQFGEDGLSLSVGAFIRLSGVFFLPRDLYAARLMVLGTRIADRVAKREHIVQLWVAFRQMRELEMERDRVEGLERLVQRLPAGMASTENRRVRDARLRLEEAFSDTQENLIELLNQRDAPIPELSTAPNYSPPELPIFEKLLSDSSISREVAAVELLRAYARIDGAKLDRWPRPDLYVYGGDFFEYRNRESDSFDWESTFLTAGTYYRLDVSGRRAARVDDARFDAALIEEAVGNRQAGLMRELRAKRSELKRIEAELEDLERRKEILSRLLQHAAPEDFLQRVEQLSMIDQERAVYMQTRIELYAFFLFHDEAFWSDYAFESPPAL